MKSFNQIHLHSVEEILAIQETVRNDASLQPAYLRAIIEQGDIVQIGLMRRSDGHWISQLASKGDVYATCCYIWGLHNQAIAYNETFYDEETGEDIQIAFYEESHGAVFNTSLQEEVRLSHNHMESKIYIDQYEHMIHNLSTKELHLLKFAAKMAKYKYQIFQDELYRRQDPEAIYDMYQLYYYGDEKQGIAPDMAKCRQYVQEFQQAISQLNDPIYNSMLCSMLYDLEDIEAS